MTKDKAITLALKVSRRENIDMFIVVEGCEDEREWEACREEDVDTFYNGAMVYLAASNGQLVL